MDNRTAARKIIEAALAAVDPYSSVFRCLTAIQAQRIFVIGAGKASARMAEAAEIFEHMMTSPDFEEFLTLEAYDHLD